MENIGLIAGNGRFPFLVAEQLRHNGDRAVIVALNEETVRDIEKLADNITWLPLGKYQKLIDFFKANNVSKVIMAGQVKHANLFAGLSLDLRAIKLLGSLINKKTDSILGAVADDLKKEGLELLPSHIYLKHLLPAKGILAGPKLSSEEKKDIEFGHKLDKQIAGMDIGQTIVVKDKAVIAVESMEGTDECIKRAASLGKEHIIVIKVAKPDQDFRFDIPVVGIKTIEVMAQSKARAIAIDAGATLLIDKERAFETAQRNGITVIAL